MKKSQLKKQIQTLQQQLDQGSRERARIASEAQANLNAAPRLVQQRTITRRECLRLAQAVTVHGRQRL